MTLNSKRQHLAFTAALDLFLCFCCAVNLRASESVIQSTNGITVTAATNAIEGATNSETDEITLKLGQLAPKALSEDSKADPKQKEEVLRARLETARNYRLTRVPAQAEPMLVELLGEGTPEAIQQSALLELSLCGQDQNDLPRANQVYAQFLNRWPSDSRAPEILLRQGQLFRQIGLNSMALAKFYAVMTAALALKNDQLEHYKQLVVKAQTEIAETTYQMGKYADAAEYFSRLLKQNSPSLNRSQVQYRLIHSLSEIGKNDEAVSQAEDFLPRFPNAPERAEVRFVLAHSLKELGRNSDSLRQVLALLREQKEQTAGHPEVWAYWQQRAGNEIANQLYREGDYTRALDVYVSLAQLDRAASWQIPVNYQIGMTYERLQQPQLATQTYSNILSRELTVGTNATPGMKSVFEMARWRIDFIKWQTHAETTVREFAEPQHETAAATAPKS
jgi:outer membrane protein assembly factor BamD (BamD/ComL family)